MRRAKHVTEAVLCCVILLVIQRSSESIRVIGGSRTVVQGKDVDLSCRLLETDEELEQITWQKRTLEEPENHNFLIIYPSGVTDFISSNGLENRVQFFGNPAENIGSIRITAARLLDEGTFTCVFSVFPSGIYSIEIPLTVLVPPVMSVTVDVPPVIGENEDVLASCLAAGAKPQAEVRWNTNAFGSLVRTVTNSTQHANGTTTVVSHLLGVPTRAANQQQVQCVVNQSALATERTLAYTININYPPQTVNITLSEASPATVFLCVADSNPKAFYTWTRVGQPWPQSAVRAEGNTLHLISLSSELNGLYSCEVSNPYGRATGSQYVHVASYSVVNKVQQRLFNLRRLKKFGLSPKALTNFYRCTIESILSGCITAWYGNCSAHNRKTLQRVVNSAQRNTKLPALQDTYTTRCHRNKIIKDNNHQSHCLFTPLSSRRRDTSAACWVLLVIIFLIVAAAAAGLVWYRWKNGKCLWSSVMGDHQFEAQSQVEEEEAEM
ncbi:nectin-3-like [Oncorhynchus clarkii lewisi]|uniref:nectin-3-like n=1 Tax=Oncorhynchus clarkii lewisi TaxID=490388 RepID=UPI0039B84A4D